MMAARAPRRKPLAVLFAVLLGLCVPRPAFAADPIDEAIALAQEARRLFDQGSYDEAYRHFARADALAHSPVFVLYMARSRRNAGRLLEARRLLERLVGETLPADAAEAMQQAHHDAEGDLERIASELPALRVDVTGEKAARARITVDGRAVAAGVPTALDPGEHRIAVSGVASSPLRRRVELERGGGTKRVVIDTTPRARAAAASDAPAAADIAGGVLVAVSAAAVIAGAVTGGLALAIADEVKESCVGEECRASDEDDADEARRLARASTGLLVIAGITGAVGITLLVVRPGTNGDEVALRLSPTSLRLGGRF
jgi:hypothetical protein